MKKWLAAIMALCMILSLAACGSKSSGNEVSFSSGIEVANDAELDISETDAAEDDTAIETADTETTEIETAAAEDTAAETETFDGAAQTGDADETDITGIYVCAADGDGIRISSDGTFQIWKDYEDRVGKVIGTWYRDGDGWMFVSPGLDSGSMTGTFDGENLTLGGKLYERYIDMSLDLTVSPWYGVYVNGDNRNVLGSAVGDLADLDFEVEADNLDDMLAPGETAELTVTCKKAEATIGVINTYEQDAPLSACRVYSFYSEDDSGKIQLDSDEHTCGQDNFDDLLTFQVYEYEPERLVYKDWIMTPFTISGLDEPYGDEVIDITGNVTITLEFDGSVLRSFLFVADGVADEGMDDNIGSGALESADSAAIAAAKAVRDDICAELTAAFADTDITLNIDEITGEITMDNSILFDTDSYELSEAGKAYIDEFVATYAQVLLSDEFRGSLSEIRFEGHTDSSGDFGYNQTLSQRRAEAVLDYCLSSTENGLTDEQKQQLEELATAQGYSSTDLIYDESGEEDAAASRRAAVRFFVNVD